MNSRSRLLALTILATLTTACAATSLSPAGEKYFIGTKPVQADREYLHRYACASGAPLACQCYSLLLGKCDCRC